MIIQPRSRILLVEDSAGDARLVSEMLAEASYSSFDILHALRLSDALQRLGEKQFDAVLLDLNLPDAGGLEAISPVREAAPDVPIVVLSGVTNEDVAIAAVQGGAQDYLVKGRGDGDLIVRSIRYAIERKRSERQIVYLAYHDPLTRLPNRRLFLDRLQQALASARRNRTRVALLYVDLDHFKQINDSLGHAAGDDLLRSMADRLTAAIRASDTVARVGGDEFGLVVPEVQEPGAAKVVAEKIRVALEQPFVVAEKELFVTASVGISLFPEDGRSADSLLKKADIAMYRCKQAGRDAQRFYSVGMDSHGTDRLALGTDLRHALERSELTLHYQPQVDLATGRIATFEALARWQHPALGAVSPQVFIPLAEELGLISRIGASLLKNACREAREWQDHGFPRVAVSVNISSLQFDSAGLLEVVSQALVESGLEPCLLELELTESGIMQNLDSAIHVLEEIRSLGVQIWVDDFGTGYSSLGHLKRFPIDGLKIDQAFVRDAENDPIDAAIVGAIVGMARGLGVKVAAEGVETEGQAAFVREQQCDRAQGFYFSRPLPSEALRDLVDLESRWH